MPTPLGEVVQQTARRQFSAADSVCLERARLLTEAWRQHEDQPPPLRRALAFAHVLAHMTLDVASNPVFAGNTSTAPGAWMLVPEHGFQGDAQVSLEHEELREFPGRFVPDDLREYWQARSFGGSGGLGHLLVDLELVVRRGLSAVLDELDQCRDDPARREYRLAMRIAVEAVIAWAARHAEAAEQAAAASADPLLAELHRQVATACRQVPARPARNLFEGLQALALVHLATAVEGQGMSVSLGSPDRVLAPFAAEAAADPRRAADLVSAFMLKIGGNTYLGRGYLSQAITVGGADHTGRDCCNAVTRAFLAGCDQVAVADPPLFLRWHPGLDPDVWQQAVTMLARGRNLPMLINDGPTAAGFVGAGVSTEDAWEYAVIGCNELGIPGRLWDCGCAIGGGLNFLEVLNRFLLEHPDPAQLDTMERLLAELASTFERTVHAGCARRGEQQRRWAEQVPTPFTTALMRGAAERGVDLMEEMPYRQPGWFERGLSNAANALAALEEVVYEARECTLAELIASLRGDHADERLRQRLAGARHWGCDDPGADRYVQWLLETRTAALRRAEAALGLLPHMPCHVVRSLHHLDGQRIAASADGRHAGAPVGDSLGAVVGTAAGGPSAMLRSVLGVDTVRHYAGGTNLNLTLPAGQATAEVVRATAEAFFGAGGQELQLAVLDAATLRQAQMEPERYGDLVVRVAGLSARFVELSPVEQNELIARAEVA